MRKIHSRPSVSNSSCLRHLRQKTAGAWLVFIGRMVVISPPSQDHLGRFVVPGRRTGGGGADPSIMSVVKELWAPSCPLCWSKRVPGGVFSTHANPKDASVLHACTGGNSLFPVAQTNVSVRRSSQRLNWCSGAAESGWRSGWGPLIRHSFMAGPSWINRRQINCNFPPSWIFNSACDHHLKSSSETSSS